MATAGRVRHCFCAGGRNLVTVSVDNRIRLWDVDTAKLRQQYEQKNHLSINYTSVSWAHNAASASRTGKRRRQSSSDLGQLALGTQQGYVVVWNLTSGDVTHQLGTAGAEHAGAVNHVAFAPNGGRLYSCSSSKQVCEWNPSDGKLQRQFSGNKHGVARVAVDAASKTLLAASARIRVLSTETGKKLKRLTGHATAVDLLQFTPDSKCVVSGASDRFLNVWDASTSTDGAAPMCGLAVDGVATAVDTATATDGSGYFVLAVVDSGAVNVWHVPSNTTGGSLKPVSRIVVGSDASTDIFAARFAVNGDGAATGDITIAHGGAVTPKFATATFTGATMAEFEESVTVAGADDAGTLVKAPGANGQATESRQLGAQVVKPTLEPLPTIAANGGAGAGADEASTLDVPLQERVDALAATLDAMDDGSDVELEDSKIVAHKRNAGSQPVVASSLQAVLEQALQAGDDAQLEYCLAVTDKDVITTTVARLPTSKVLPFLAKVVQRFERRPSHSLELVMWLRAVLVQHASYLMTVPGLMRKMSRLYQTVDARVKVFPKLLKLSGRLDLVLSQLSTRDRNDTAQAATAGTVYHEDGAGEGGDSESDDADDDDEDMSGEGSDDDSEGSGGDSDEDDNDDSDSA